MGTCEKKRIAKEADFVKDNADVKSICCGEFYNRKKKKYEVCENCAKCFKFKEYNLLKDKEKESRPEVKFHYIDSFRKCEFYRYRPIDSTYLLTTTTYNILYINDMACNYVKDLSQDVKNSGDKELKIKYGAAIKRVNRYNEMIYDIIGNKIEFYAEYNGNMDDHVDESADAFYDRMKEIFKEMGQENYEFLAKVEIARTMVGYSVSAINKMVAEAVRFKEDAVSLYTYRLLELVSIMEDFSRWAFRKIKRGFDMNKDEKLMSAYRKLNGNLINRENVCASITAAEELYGKR